MSASRWQEPNLARNPFVNERPVRRLAILLWVLALLAGGAGFWMSRSIRLETGARVADLARLNAATVSDRDRAVRLEAELRSANLPAQNARAEFLNRRIAERSFSWNGLLETLTGAMPRGVRLVRLAPEGFTRERGRVQADAQTAATTRVALRIFGEAEETEALLEFVDRLFAHPAFDKPNLSRESARKDLKIQFDIAVDYLPQAAAQGATASAAGTSGAADPAATAAGLPATAGAPAAAAVAAAPVAAAVAGAPEGAGKPGTGGSGAGRALPSSRPAAAGGSGRAAAGAIPSREELGVDPKEVETGSGAARGGAAASGASRMGGFPAGSAPGLRGGGTAAAGPRGGSTAQPAPGAGAGGKSFPTNVMPTPLRPYASSTGGGR